MNVLLGGWEGGGGGGGEGEECKIPGPGFITESGLPIIL